jgi:hypothetical protein
VSQRLEHFFGRECDTSAGGAQRVSRSEGFNNSITCNLYVTIWPDMNLKTSDFEKHATNNEMTFLSV